MDNNISELLEYMKKMRAIDFSSYRPATIRRRLERRLFFTRMPDFNAYFKYLRENPKELDSLIDSFAIKVSHFFRDPIVFEAIGKVVLPELLDAHRDKGLRIWCAGCARGEETYSIAIMIRDLIGTDANAPQVFIIGTDMDKEALGDARKARYKPDSVSEVKKKHLDKYFTLQDGLYSLNDEIKSMVTFAYHDLTTCTNPREGIFSDYHLVLCRNVLIYFDRSLCERISRSFFRSIPSSGYLTLGEAESLPAELAGGFQEIMPGTKVFRKL